MIQEQGNPFFANMQEEINYINSLPKIQRQIYLLKYNIKTQKRHIMWNQKQRGHFANEGRNMITLSYAKIEGYQKEIAKLEEELQSL